MEFPHASLIDYVSGVLGLFSFAVSVGTFVMVLAGRKAAKAEQARQEQRVKIRLLLQSEGNRTRLLPISLPRRMVSRAEVLGLMGMMPMTESGKRFSIRYLSSIEFLASIEEAQKSSGEYELIIPVSQAEFEQFA